MATRPPGSRNGGLGNPHEEPYFYQGYRDFGQNEPPQRDIVFDPTKDPMRADPGRQRELSEFFVLLEGFLKKNIFLSKRPSFIEPPFFAKPVVKNSTVTVPGAGAATLILDYPIADRQKVSVTAMGINTDNPQVLGNHELLFWFSLNEETAPAGQVGDIIPIFDDQSAVAAALAGFARGKTTIVPGTTTNPFSLVQAGTPVVVRANGAKRLQFWCQNYNVVDVEICALITLYQYWTPDSAEFEKADLQT